MLQKNRANILHLPNDWLSIVRMKKETVLEVITKCLSNSFLSSVHPWLYLYEDTASQYWRRVESFHVTNWRIWVINWIWVTYMACFGTKMFLCGALSCFTFLDIKIMLVEKRFIVVWRGLETQDFILKDLTLCIFRTHLSKVKNF